MPEAILTFGNRIEYLKIHWTDKEIRNFENRIKQYLEVLKDEPYIGKRPGKLKNVYIGVIIKPVSLIYRVKSRTKEIELLLFIDNRQDPKRIKKYKT
jgi:plasmid stabilization system protein ParE